MFKFYLFEPGAWYLINLSSHYTARDFIHYMIDIIEQGKNYPEGTASLKRISQFLWKGTSFPPTYNSRVKSLKTFHR